MKILPLTILFIVCLSCISKAQTPITVIENTVKVKASSTKEFFYGFAKGDKIIFTLTEEKSRKGIKEVEIVEYPSTTKIKERDVNNMSKEIQIPKDGIYKFRMYNANAFASRLCRFKIQRVPASSATTNFNTTITWKTFIDTTYRQVQERYVIKSDTILHYLVTNDLTLNANQRRVVNFTLPLKASNWAYWIGVENEGKLAYELAQTKLSCCNTPKITANQRNSPVAALAMNTPHHLPKVSNNTPVRFYFLTNETSSQLFKSGSSGFSKYKEGYTGGSFGKMTRGTRTTSYLGLLNPSNRNIRVKVEIVAFEHNTEYGTRTVEKREIKERRVPFLTK